MWLSKPSIYEFTMCNNSVDELIEIKNVEKDIDIVSSVFGFIVLSFQSIQKP